MISFAIKSPGRKSPPGLENDSMDSAAKCVEPPRKSLLFKMEHFRADKQNIAPKGFWCIPNPHTPQRIAQGLALRSDIVWLFDQTRCKSPAQNVHLFYQIRLLHSLSNRLMTGARFVFPQKQHYLDRLRSRTPSDYQPIIFFFVAQNESSPIYDLCTGNIISLLQRNYKTRERKKITSPSAQNIAETIQNRIVTWDSGQPSASKW